MGGSSVNKEFKAFLGRLVNDKKFTRYIQTNNPLTNARHSADLNELVNKTFEDQKIIFGNKGGVGSRVGIHLPFTFIEVYKDDLDNGVRQMKDSRLKRVGFDLRIDNSFMADFFSLLLKGFWSACLRH